MNELKIASYNVNGIRAAIKKGFVEWLAENPFDIVCLQETKAMKDNVNCCLFEELGYQTYWFSAQKKGYSGVAVFTKVEPLHVVHGTQIEQSDFEGRVIQLDFEHFSLVNAYFPSGTSGDIRQAYKYQWLDEFYDYINELRTQKRGLVITGDYNICHKPIDIHDPVGNRNSSGFLPEEREWLGKFFAAGYIDTFRYLHPERAGAYSWWSQRFPSARLNNKGWRIDYISVSENLAHNIAAAEIHPDAKHSDHCPVSIDLKF